MTAKELKILKENFWDDDGYGHETKHYDDTMFALDMAIKALEQRWIPVSERLPEVNGKYLVTETTTVNGLIGEYIEVEMYANDLYKIDEFNFWDKQGVAGWYDYDGEYGYYEVDNVNVIAWMPLPEPYKAESEDK